MGDIFMKTIRVSEENHYKLSKIGLKSETYDDIIERLITIYENWDLEDFDEEKADYYNNRIKQFESGNYEGTRKVDLNARIGK